jgi:pyruvate kinase
MIGGVRLTKIVATVGPASRDPETLVHMVDAGMDVVRLNFSHGSHEEHAETVHRVRVAAERAGRPIAILQDLPGPKLRIGPVEGGRVDLVSGSTVTISCGDEEILGTSNKLWLSWKRLASSIQPGDPLYLADGAVRLIARATRPGNHEVDCEAEIGGSVVSRQGVNIPAPVDELPAVPEEDLAHLRAGLAMGVDMVALSFVRQPEDVHFVREHTDLPLIAKIEKPQAVNQMDEIIEAADAIMVARGDLGIELLLEEVPIVQKRLLERAGSRARPSITATQMLESMVTAARPTRAEVSDVANAILDGTDAVMLSQETAVGAHPVGAVAMMDAIARTTERSAPYRRWNEGRVKRTGEDSGYAVAHAACAAARELNLDALIVPTITGRSARLVSAHRPSVPIYALSPGPETVRMCGVMWGVQAAIQRQHAITEELIADAVRRVVELGWCTPGMRVGITAGLPAGQAGSTSLFHLQTICP